MSWINQGKLQPKSLHWGRKERPWKLKNVQNVTIHGIKRIKREVGRETGGRESS
jgi:hypothetical protein